VLYFSKLKIITVILISIVFTYLSFSNLFRFDDNFIKNKINLGLDLQGGSYLLLEIDNQPIISQTLQTQLVNLKKYFSDKSINVRNLYIEKNKIYFETDKSLIDKVKEILIKKDNELNPYFEKFKTHQYIVDNKENYFSIYLSDYGIVLLNTSSLDQAVEIVRRRVDETGTNEPNILKRGNNRILVELPGLDDPSRIKSLLGKTANLTFQLVSSTENDSFGTELLKFDNGIDEAFVSKRIILNGDNLVDAKPRMDTQNNETIVSFTLDRVGAKKFGKATTENVGKQLAIILDGKIISAPSIREPIVGGSGQISGNFTFQSATDLALLLRSGALPAPMNIIEERTVGPDLGKDSIKAGILSLIIGFSLVVLFMIYKYRIFGFIANFALITNLLLLIGVLTLLGATLTLPGIAGIILTVGMAVDANVLIFERIKEEIKIEKNQIIAFDSGYVKSRTAIIDANITTLIATVILFFMGSGPIKGFSVTLGIGILTTLFSVYFIARLLSSIYVKTNKDKEKLI
tara:strand:- start:7922 stop:9475 length:1554 start_codon:yes stop_codon:yes gene_type:complete